MPVESDAEDVSARRLAATGTRFAIATPRDVATRAGLAAFRAGGNALDAAIAAATTLAVTYPMMCGVGGDLFALVQTPGNAPASIESAGRSPRALDGESVRATHPTMPARGPFSITVPGAVAGWASIHELGARLPWAAAFERAIGYAAEGVDVAPGVAASISDARDVLARDPGARAIYLPDGRPLRAGERLVNAALADTLRSIADDGAEALYGGDVGERYVLGLRQIGCPIAVGDLTAHRALTSAPLVGGFRGLEVSTSPPTSQGFSMLQALGVIEALGLDPDPLGPDAGRIALAFAGAARERDAHLADPDAMRVPVSELLSAEATARLCAFVAADTIRSAEDVSPLGGTAGLVAADRDGYAVSLIQSLSWGFGAGILERATGILAQNRGSGFVLDPDHANALAAGKLPAHTLMPVMAHRDGRLAAVSGTMGGPAHPQINTMSLSRAFALGTSAGQAVAAPRWIVGGLDALDGVVEAEQDVGDATTARLETVGFRVRRLSSLDAGAGHAQLVVVGDDGALDVGADPRADGEAAAS